MVLIRGIINIMQAARKTMLATSIRMSPLLRLEAIKRTAHITKTTHPKKWYLTSCLNLSLDNCVISSF
jgi:hypothetical protein